MPTHTYNKLVRDKIPEIIAANGDHAVWKKITGTDFRHALLMKVIEEAREYTKKPSPEEEADLQEILLKARDLYDYSAEDVELARKKQAAADNMFGSNPVLYYAADYIKIRTAEAEAGVQHALAYTRENLQGGARYEAEDVEAIRVQKAETNGTFEDGIYLQYVEVTRRSA